MHQKTWKKKLIYRSWHRGIKEADLLLGPFADQYLNDFQEDQLQLYESILSIPDQELIPILYGQIELPKKYENEVMLKLIKEIRGRRINYESSVFLTKHSSL